MTVFNSAALFAAATFVRSAAPRLFPAGESPFPAAPWHTAHFALNIVALLLLCPLAGAVTVRTGRDIIVATATNFRNFAEIIFKPSRVYKHENILYVVFGSRCTRD